MRVSTDVWDKLIAFGNVTPVLLCDADSAYGTLGDELGQSGTASLEDAAGAIAAYRKALTFDDRVLSIDPHSLRARRGISIYDMKIGSVDMETDPAAAVKEFTAALQNAEALHADARHADAKTGHRPGTVGRICPVGSSLPASRRF
jgi:hypothetical protein